MATKKIPSELGYVLGILIGTALSVLVIWRINYVSELKQHRALQRDDLLELILEDEHFDEDLSKELRECIRNNENYTALYSFSSLSSGDPSIEFIFNLPPLDCPCGCGQLTPARTVDMKLYQKYRGEWYTLSSSVEYGKGD